MDLTFLWGKACEYELGYISFMFNHLDNIQHFLEDLDLL